MPKTTQNREREVQLILRVTPDEKALIYQKMECAGIRHFNRYARKMLLDGYIVRLDLSPLDKLSAEVNKVGVNFNQIAKIANASGHVSPENIGRMEAMITEIWQLLKSYLSALLSKSQ